MSLTLRRFAASLPAPPPLPEVAPTSTQIPGARGRPSSRRNYRRGVVAYAFLAPFLVGFLLLFIVPIAYAFYLSLQSVSGTFIGDGNYVRVLQDHDFFDAIRRVLLFFVVQVPVMLGLATIFALALDSEFLRFRNLFRVSFFIPFAIPGVIAALLWGFLYSPTIGPLAHIHALSGINFLAPHVLLWSIANIVTWEYAGYNMIILFAALQAIPHDLYEAARIDGCNDLGVARYIKLPLLAPALVLTFVFSIIGTLQLFNEPAIMTQLTSAPSNYTPNLYIASLHGVGADNYAAALAFVLAAITFVFSLAFMWVTSRGGMSS